MLIWYFINMNIKTNQYKYINVYASAVTGTKPISFYIKAHLFTTILEDQPCYSQTWKIKLRERLNDLYLHFVDFKSHVLLLLNNNNHKNNIKIIRLNSDQCHNLKSFLYLLNSHHIPIISATEYNVLISIIQTCYLPLTKDKGKREHSHNDQVLNCFYILKLGWWAEHSSWRTLVANMFQNHLYVWQYVCNICKVTYTHVNIN